MDWKKGRDPQGILATPVLGQIALHFLKQKRSGAWFDLVIAESKTTQKLTETAL